MAIKAITPREITLPHIGGVKYNFRSINFFVWLESKEFKSGEQYISAIIQDQLKSDGGELDCGSLNDDQLNEIAHSLFTDVSENDDSITESELPPISLQPSARLLALHITKMEDTREQTAKAMKPIIGSLQRTLAASRIFERPTHMELFKQAESMGQLFKPPAGLKAIMESQKSLATQLGTSVNRIGQVYAPLLVEFNEIGRSLSRDIGALDIGSSILIGDAITKSVLNNIKLAQTSMKLFEPQIGFLGKFSESYLSQNFKLAGFLSTVEAGLNDLAPKSAAADIIARYHSKSLPSESALAVSLEAVKSLDTLNDNGDLSDNDIESLLKKISESVLYIIESKNVAVGRLSLYQLAMMLLTVVCVYLTAQGANEKQLEKIIKQNDRIIELRETEIERNEEAYKYFRSLKAAYNLRSGPDINSQLITTLNADQIVIVSKVRGDWALIEVMPYADEPRLTGWIHRDGLLPF